MTRTRDSGPEGAGRLGSSAHATYSMVLAASPEPVTEMHCPGAPAPPRPAASATAGPGLVHAGRGGVGGRGLGLRRTKIVARPAAGQPRDHPSPFTPNRNVPSCPGPGAAVPAVQWRRGRGAASFPSTAGRGGQRKLTASPAGHAARLKRVPFFGSARSRVRSVSAPWRRLSLSSSSSTSSTASLQPAAAIAHSKQKCSA